MASDDKNVKRTSPVGTNNNTDTDFQALAKSTIARLEADRAHNVAVAKAEAERIAAMDATSLMAYLQNREAGRSTATAPKRSFFNLSRSLWG